MQLLCVLVTYYSVTNGHKLNVLKWCHLLTQLMWCRMLAWALGSGSQAAVKVLGELCLSRAQSPLPNKACYNRTEVLLSNWYSWGGVGGFSQLLKAPAGPCHMVLSQATSQYSSSFLHGQQNISHSQVPSLPPENFHLTRLGSLSAQIKTNWWWSSITSARALHVCMKCN